MPPATPKAQALGTVMHEVGSSHREALSWMDVHMPILQPNPQKMAEHMVWHTIQGWVEVEDNVVAVPGVSATCTVGNSFVVRADIFAPFQPHCSPEIYTPANYKTLPR
eukprot:comp12362_c1_seq1/m.7245 comp12362_c1_seq1/g.7245  ORF comp12362_c1_seq1/g.7245 comp12362_c1_seq1/m.7245 type:complete len:108 (+) comp12362_c1_seq1:1298-1621(+)